MSEQSESIYSYPAKQKNKSAKDTHERKRYKASIHIINVAIVVYNDSLNIKILRSPWGCPNGGPSNRPKYHA